MTPAQQTALQALVGRALTAGEVKQVDLLLPDRNDVAIAALLSIGRTRLVEHMIGARGVRTALPIVQAVEFLALLRDTAAANSIPEWLETLLTVMRVPAEQHFAYFDTMACAHDWLQQEAGIDLGAATTRAMLDMIAASDPSHFGASVAILKQLAERADPIPFTEVSRVLNVAEGRMIL
jgi:hypothetical protein